MQSKLTVSSHVFIRVSFSKDSPAISPTSQVGSSYAQVIIVPTVSFTMATTSSSNSCEYKQREHQASERQTVRLRCVRPVQIHALLSFSKRVWRMEFKLCYFDIILMLKQDVSLQGTNCRILFINIIPDITHVSPFSLDIKATLSLKFSFQ